MQHHISGIPLVLWCNCILVIFSTWNPGLKGLYVLLLLKYVWNLMHRFLAWMQISSLPKESKKISLIFFNSYTSQPNSNIFHLLLCRETKRLISSTQYIFSISKTVFFLLHHSFHNSKINNLKQQQYLRWVCPDLVAECVSGFLEPLEVERLHLWNTFVWTMKDLPHASTSRTSACWAAEIQQDFGQHILRIHRPLNLGLIFKFNTFNSVMLLYVKRY